MMLSLDDLPLGSLYMFILVLDKLSGDFDGIVISVFLISTLVVLVAQHSKLWTVKAKNTLAIHRASPKKRGKSWKSFFLETTYPP